MAAMSMPCVSRFLASSHLRPALGGHGAGECIRVKESTKLRIPRLCVRAMRAQASPRGVEDELQGYWEQVHICNAGRVRFHFSAIASLNLWFLFYLIFRLKLCDSSQSSNFESGMGLG